mmetsp:Transcript_35260/g.84043  ORF Transcript_35260/g.84043 Transcript_35260/m.84043 type:complete len:217 (+) Transcript_35260:120-770(+)
MVVSSAISRMTRPWPGTTSKTAISVMMRSTTPRPVSGSVVASKILGEPFLAACSMVTTTREPEPTRSMAPPMPFTILPGMIQLDKSPVADTCSAPSTVRSTARPRIMPNDSEEEKMEEPGIMVTVSLPALMRSASTSSAEGYGPMPSKPFSLCSSMRMPGARKLDASVGMPMPRFTYMPSSNSCAARLTMRPREPPRSVAAPPDGSLTVTRSMRFS